MNPDDKEVQSSLQAETRTDQSRATNLNPVQTEPQTQKIPNLQKTSKGLVLITGATSGIGKATAEIFALNGYRLILTGRRVDRLVALKDHLETSYGTDILLLPFDVRDPGAVEAALTSLPDTFSEVDILVNNAGLAKGLAPIHEGQLDHWETMIDTNIKGLLYVTRLISPGMVQRRRGHIINVCSSAGREAYPNGNVYCATKFAVDALTKSIRFDLHPYDIRVSQVSPGHVEETEFALNRFDGDADRAKIYQDFQPLKSSDVADAIFYLATRPPHVNIVDIQMFATQQASSMVINRNGRRFE
ncbi:MAG: SDR family NAD(P)-dependent oxidoreductase [Chitinophagales bacterium]|nr:SDR family NAD(P)-dependent oxidoreductase [Chitinophagales bacterium]